VAVLLGDYLLASATELITGTGNTRVFQLFARTARLLSSGELRELHVTFNWQAGRDNYWERINRKTASLFSTAAQSGAILGEAPEAHVQALGEFGANLGMAFQVVDDILDFQGLEKEVGKPVGNDLLQGVLTLPTILFLEKCSDEEARRLAQEPPGDPEAAALLVDRVRNSHAIEEAYRVADDFSQRARSALEGLQDGIYLRALLELIDYTTARSR
jgi:geranylgeranyl pyrophosphate synthase